MSLLAIGDRASTFQIRRFSSDLKADLTRLGQELATGRRADLGAAVSGDFGPAAAIERSLTALAAYRTTASETAQLFEAAQLALGEVQSISRAATPGLLTAGNSRDRAMIAASATDARQKFEAVAARLNTRVADRTLFAGAATDGPAMASGAMMLASLKSATAGATTATDVVAAVDAWFDTPGGGFESSGYLGSDAAFGAMAIAEGETIGLDVRADDSVVRETLKALALASLVAEDVLAGDADAQAALFSEAADRLIATDGAVTDLRARIGAAEARVETAKTRNAAEAAAYDLALGELVAVDPYETATELEAVYSQIETLYTVTARIAGLRFTDYMR